MFAASKMSFALFKLYLIILLVFIGFFFAPKVNEVTIRPVNVLLLFLIISGIIFKPAPYKIFFIFLICSFGLFTLINSNKFYFGKGLAASILLFFCFFQYVITFRLVSVNPEVFIEKISDFLIQLSFIYMCVVVFGVLLNIFGIENSLVAPNWQAALYNDAEYTQTTSIIGYHTLTACYLASVGVLLVGKLLFLKYKSLFYEIFRLVIIVIGLISSYSRGSWLCFGFGSLLLLFFYFRTHKVKLLSYKIFIPVFLVLIVYIVISTNDEVFNILNKQFANLVDTEEGGTGYDRLIMWGGMINDIFQNPLVGSGGGAFLQYTTYIGSPSENFFLEIFHSAGLVGFLGVLIPIIILITQSIRIVSNKNSIMQNPRLAIVFAASVGLLIPMFTTPGAWGGFFWLFIGVWAAAVMHHKKVFEPFRNTAKLLEDERGQNIEVAL